MPKERPRVTRRGTYTPTRTKHHEHWVAEMYRINGGPYYYGLVKLTIHAYRKGKRTADWDNIGKAVSDGLEGVAYKNDSQVRQVIVIVEYDSDDPRTEIWIDALEG